MAQGNHRVWRWIYWVASGLSLAGTLYFLNLTIYHFWAAYVPPYQTKLHEQWALHSAEILGLFVVFFVWCLIQLWRTRQRS
jgi:hypothetical protein